MMNPSHTRLAFVMQLKPGFEAQYQQRHDELWPELAQTLKAHGAHNYSIFLHPDTLQLFGYVEVESQARWQTIANTEVCQRWWSFMAELMEVNDDSSPQSTPLTDMFYLA
ncbi:MULTISPECIES: L-rhamnose mutarotase [Vibrio]|uniref:L-rhamnose mutarotase n=2 Tax=Vibrio TaxID=662 RepID=UPI001E628CE9|nr:L-rhamnose mutarotase [Vibrio furnissii]MCG6213661.1 L-rhamnose mutarotase [Vibrio furnissii]MCG6229035.1 L-rhamnose mutarotase [Vibrio furnissii]MCG6266910.1 L-rhamnose mutarotase [Vibrio furnissii]UHJ62983.1 L-rhamnose mutarotase [Vibrio furnissii]WHR53384.1 L-rhamnose mutarotase [Vibrio furnissii]